jgi:hypothetical protein
MLVLVFELGHSKPNLLPTEPLRFDRIGIVSLDATYKILILITNLLA